METYPAALIEPGIPLTRRRRTDSPGPAPRANKKAPARAVWLWGTNIRGARKRRLSPLRAIVHAEACQLNSKGNIGRFRDPLIRPAGPNPRLGFRRRCLHSRLPTPERQGRGCVVPNVPRNHTYFFGFYVWFPRNYISPETINCPGNEAIGAPPCRSRSAISGWSSTIPKRSSPRVLRDGWDWSLSPSSA